MTTSIKKILVGFDFSPGCENALRRAGQLARAWEASLEVVHVLKEVPYSGATQNRDLVDWMGTLERELSDRLASQTCAILPADLAVDARVLTGVPRRDLLQRAGAIGADLLILGAGSHGKMEGMFLGRTAEGVLQDSHLPVWMEKGPEVKPIDSILLPTDLSEHSRPAVLAGLDWARQLKANPHLLHAVEIPFLPHGSMLEHKDLGENLGRVAQEQLDKFVESLPQDGLDLTSFLTFGDPVGEVDRYLQEHQVGLVALSTHGRTGLASRLLGSVALRVLRHAQVPVMITRPKN